MGKESDFLHFPDFPPVIFLLTVQFIPSPCKIQTTDSTIQSSLLDGLLFFLQQKKKKRF